VPVSANITAFFGAGYTVGSWSGGTYPTTQGTGTIIITGSFGNYLGFTSGTYQGINTTTPLVVSVAGNSLQATPPYPALGSTVNAITIRCNLIDNSVSIPSDILDSFPITSSFGSNINYTPMFDKWVKIRSGKQSNLLITLTDQSGNTLQSNDPNVLIVLLIRKNI
jgi:hypothetical protein